MVALELKDVSKSFAGIHALKDITFSVEAGQICSIVGENGAGKSTLMRVIAGAHAPDTGTVKICGKQMTEFTPSYAQASGVGIVYQELSLIPEMSVYENIYLGHPILRGILYDHKAMAEKCREALGEVGLGNISPHSMIKDLSVAQQQLVEIARVLVAEASILIMDEPTSSLSEQDSSRLLRLLTELKDKGKTILYISHRLNEVQQISDTIVVLRDGNFIEHNLAKNLKHREIIEMMVGKAVDRVDHMKKDTTGLPAILSVQNLCVKPRIKNASFELKKGEVLGFAGLVGAGRSELMRGVFGVDKPTGGSLVLNGKKIRHITPAAMLKNETRLCLVPENRKEEGLIFGKSVGENIAITYRNFNYKGGLIKKGLEDDVVREYSGKLQIKCSSTDQCVEDLSGGNQQKVVLAKMLSTKPDILILDEPTRGIDVGAKAEIHKIISQLSKEGVSIILVSSELSELALLCDRVLVMSDGKIVAEMDREITESAMLKEAIPC
ncbi:sugar ABC transporter ATP-binding protein [Christensenella intestinihominis]|uniref:sugar ABC transporter ATP-binding protein n=1 Tax=Christensenella intestinihominis TaxID=1851429 RepID=UPI000A893AD6|nr:sugar ABC transporter ATP-binding protein [Christensenella intestinihominis]